jgi:hypothetical protein
MDERQAVGWSASLFKRVYPKQYAKLFHQGHTLTKTEEAKTPKPALAAQEPIRIVVGLNKAGVMDVVSNVPIEVVVLDNVIDDTREHPDARERIVALPSDTIPTEYYVYRDIREGNVNSDYTTEVFLIVEAMENGRQAA